MVNLGAPAAVLEMNEAQVTAKTLGLEVHRLEIRQAQDITPDFVALKGLAGALYSVSTRS